MAPALQPRRFMDSRQTSDTSARQIRVATLLFVLLAVSTVVPLVASNLWGYLSSRSLLEGAAEREVRDLAAREAAKAASFMTDARSFLQAIAPEALAPDTEERIQDHVRAHPTLDGLAALGPAGEVLLEYQEEGPSLDRDAARACVADSRPEGAVVDFRYGEGAPRLLVAAGRPEAGSGALCGRFRFDVHGSLVATESNREHGVRLYLLDRRGRVVCGSFEGVERGPIDPRHAGDHATHGHGPAQDHDHGDAAAAAAFVEERGVGAGAWVGRDERDGDETRVIAYAPIPGTSMGVIAETPQARALEPLHELSGQAFALGGVLALLVVIGVYLLGRHITRPLVALADAAGRLRAGALDERVDAAGPREVWELSDAFNRMLDALAEARRDLEIRIAERTAELEQASRFTELVLDSIEPSVVVVDAEGTIRRTNSSAKHLFGEDARGRLHPAIVQRRRKGEGPTAIERALADGVAATEERSLRVGGRQEIVASSVHALASPDSGGRSVVEVAEVVTDERRLNAQMVHNEKMAAFGLLAAGVAHEIGNPLASIASQLRMSRDVREPEGMARTLEIVEREVQRIDRLLRELAMLARRKRDTTRAVALHQVLADVAQLLRHDPRARAVDIRVEASEALPPVRASEDALTQVVLNLGMNALGAMPDGGDLRFVASADKRELCVVVRDSGSGVPEGVRERIFEPFYTTRQGSGGTGLGLFVSRRIVEGLGGRLELSTSGLGGSTFAIYLPVSSPDRGTAPRPKSAEEA